MSSAVLLFMARVLVLVLLYLFLFLVVRALRRDLRSAATVTAVPAGTARLAPDAARLGTACLEIVDAGQTPLAPGQCFALRDPLVIGRAPSNDITLDDDWVSAQHVRLRRRNGAWMAEDMGSTNGTRVNGRPLKGSARLGPGDVLDLGRVKLRLVEGA